MSTKTNRTTVGAVITIIVLMTSMTLMTMPVQAQQIGRAHV